MSTAEDFLPHANHNKPRTKEEKAKIINEAAEAYAKFLDALRIDWKNDPHSTDTP